MSAASPASAPTSASPLAGAGPFPSVPIAGGTGTAIGNVAVGVPDSAPDVASGAGTVALSLWAAQLQAAFLAAEAGSVLTLRMMSFSGLRPTVPGEHLRMVVEKPPAFLAAALAAWIATVSGQRADQVLAAAIRPLRAEASANVLRLSR